MIFDMTKRVGGTGGYTLEEIINCIEPSGDIDLDNYTFTAVKPYMFYNCPITTIKMTQSRKLGDSMCRNCKSLTSAFIKGGSGAGYLFASCTNLQTAVINMGGNQGAVFSGCSSLEGCDIGTSIGYMGVNFFQNCTNLHTIILRRASTPTTLGLTTVFTGTPFASGGSGGTIYIPEALYNRLGDGSTKDYKSLSYWSTINGYGTITWAKIEGSIYENAYVDGTLIT